jgi:hypothetical protein
MAGSPDQTGLYSKSEWKTQTIRHSCTRKSRRPDDGQKGLRAKLGSPVREPQLRVPSGSQLSRCHRTMGSLTQRYVKRHDLARKSAKTRCLHGVPFLFLSLRFQDVFWGEMPTESRSFSSEKSYSPSRLICSHEMTEWLATAARSAALNSSVES